MWRFWKGNCILRVHMYLLSWLKTNFLCITSILSPKSMSKLINVNCLHFIGCQNYTNVLINRVSYQIQVTALLPFFLSILHLLLQLSKIMLWSTVKLLLAIVMSIIFGPLKTLPRSSKSCDCVTFQGSQVSSFDFSTLYTSLPHDLIKAKVLSLVNWCFNRESKSYLCTSLKAGFFSNKKYDSYRCWSCAELCEAFTFLMENIYVQFDGMVYQQIVGFPMGTNCAPLIADLFLYCYERDFMSDLQKSKRHDLIDMFNDTSRYLDDIFTIDNPEFEKYIPDIYPAELQLNKANTSDKETSFLDLNIKVIGSDIHTSVYDKRDDFGFPIVNFPWLSGDVPRLPSYGIYISQLVRFARCCTSVLDFHSKNLQITSKLLTQGYRYHKLRKTFGKFFRSYSELLSKFGDISFQEYVFKGISHPVFYGDLVYKLRRVKDTPNFISSGSKIVKRLRRRQYDPSIIETTIGLVLGPCTALCRLFLKHCTLTNKAVGTIWRALSKPPQRRQGPDLRPLWLLVGTPSAIRPELAFSRAEHSLPYSDVTIYIFCYIIFIIYALRVTIFMTSPLGVAVGLLSI